MEVTFSLTCNTTGGPVSSVIWTRDDLLLDNTCPLVPTNASIASYTNVLEVNNRTPGTYTCQIRGADNQILGSKDLAVDGKLCVLYYFGILNYLQNYNDCECECKHEHGCHAVIMHLCLM